MKLTMAFVVLMSVILIGADATGQDKKQAAKDANKQKVDLGGLAGAWKVTLWSEKGKTISFDTADLVWYCDGDGNSWLSIQSLVHSSTVRVTVDTKKRPHHIDVDVEGSATKLGLFSLKGDTLLMCGGKERPKAMASETTKEDEFVVLKLKRLNEAENTELQVPFAEWRLSQLTRENNAAGVEKWTKRLKIAKARLAKLRAARLKAEADRERDRVARQAEQRRVRVAEARKELAQLNTGLLAFRKSLRFFPTSKLGLQALVARPETFGRSVNWEGPYVKEPVLTDPWGQAYRYNRVNPKSFKLWSLGPDGNDGTDDDIQHE